MKRTYGLTSSDFAALVFWEFLISSGVCGSEWNTASGKNGSKGLFTVILTVLVKMSLGKVLARLNST